MIDFLFETIRQLLLAILLILLILLFIFIFGSAIQLGVFEALKQFECYKNGSVYKWGPFNE